MPDTVVQPGDVLLVRTTQGGWLARTASRLIRFGAAWRDQPNVINHVIVAHHVDAAGTFWGVEGRPGGVGWVELAPWLADPWTVHNAAQPRTDVDRALICESVLAAVGRPYDWGGIVKDAAKAAAPLWTMRDCWGPGIPGHVVCSSLADWAYERAGLPSPESDRFCTPANWYEWILAQGWNRIG